MDETILPEKLLKAGEVAEILQVSKTQIYRLLGTELPCVRFGGGTVRVRKDDLDKYIISHTIRPVTHSHTIER